MTEKIYASDVNLKKEDVCALFEWLENQPHLPQLTELQVILFLHSCYYDLESAKITIQKYLTVKTTSEICRSPSEEVIKRTLDVIFAGFLPRRTPDDSVVSVIKLLDTDPTKYNCFECIQTMLSVLSLYLLLQRPANGHVLILDSTGLTFRHLFRSSISIVRQYLYFVQEAAPIRIKGVHVINCVPVTRHFVILVKPFLTKEVYEMLRIHTDYRQTLYEYVPRQCLPEEYGGTLSSLAEIHEKNKVNIIENLGFLRSHDAQIIDENKRVKVKSGGLGGALRSWLWR